MNFWGGLWFRSQVATQLLITGVFACTAGLSVSAASVTLAWDPNVESDIAGYRIHYGTNSRAYTVTMDSGNRTNQTVSNLVTGVTYYFAATAYNTSGLESDPSTELAHTIPVPNSSPAVSDIANTNTVMNGSLTIPFTIRDNETLAANLSLSGASSNTTLLPNASIVFGGSGSNRTVAVTPAPNQTGTAVVAVTVSDGVATATDSFVLTVDPPSNTSPTISDIIPRTIQEDASTGTIPFTIGDAESGAGTLTLSKASSDTSLVPLNRIAFGGSGSNRNVTVTPAANQSGTATITVTVSDGQLSVTDSFTLTVNAVNDGPTIANISDQTITSGTTVGPIAFTVHDVDTAASGLTLSARSSNQSLVPETNVVFGGSGTNRTVAVTAATGQTGTATITVSVTDAALSASDTFMLSVTSSAISSTNVATMSFTNAGTIIIPELGAATPYPSTLNVSGLEGTITNLTVRFNGFAQTYPADVDVLLVGPAGQKVMIMSDVGGGYAVTGVDLTLSDSATGTLPQSTSLASGTFRPTDMATGETMPAPAPAGPYATTLSTFNGSTANGVWSLYVVDDGPWDEGSFANGWSLTITAVEDGPRAPSITDIADQFTTVNTATAAVPFNISDDDTPVDSLSIKGVSSNQTLVPNSNIVFGGSGTNRTMTITPATGQTGTATITVSVTDAALMVSDTFLLTVTSTTGSSNNVTTASITNAATIVIPDVGAATPYPSIINVNGLDGTISDVTVRLNGFEHTYAADVDVLLVGPTGQKVMVMSDAGGGYYWIGGVNLTLTDQAAVALPQSPPLASGTYKPTDVSPGETMPAPAPAGPYATTLSAFNGLMANGAWSLYVLDDGSMDEGRFVAGWSLSITTTAETSTMSTLRSMTDQLPATNMLASSGSRRAPLALTETKPTSPEILSIKITNHLAVVTWSAIPGLTYVLEYSDDSHIPNWVAFPPVTATGPTAAATQAIAPAPHRFYRVRLVQ